MEGGRGCGTGDGPLAGSHCPLPPQSFGHRRSEQSAESAVVYQGSRQRQVAVV